MPYFCKEVIERVGKMKNKKIYIGLLSVLLICMSASCGKEDATVNDKDNVTDIVTDGENEGTTEDMTGDGIMDVRNMKRKSRM